MEIELIKKYNLSPGDRIITPKSYFRLIKHHSLYLGQNELGQHFICENVIGQGVILTRVKDFFEKNFEITRIEKFHGTEFQRKQIINRALAKLGTEYSLPFYNCETFVNDVTHGKKISLQVNNVVLGLVSVLFISLILNNNGKKSI